MTEVNRLLDAALEIQSLCLEQGWSFCFIGGIAVQHWGEARVTRDADLTLFTGIGDESHYADTLLARFEARISDARDFSLTHRVLLLRASNSIPLDVAFGALDFERKAVETARDEEIVAGVRLRLCSPGVLVVFKAFAGRPQDWLDIDGICAKSSPQLRWDEIRSDLAPLLEIKGDADSLFRLETIVKQRGAAD